MPTLAPIDFKAADQGYPVIPVPTGETKWLEAVSKEWDADMNKAGDGMVVTAKYSVAYEGPLVVNRGTTAEPDWGPGYQDVSRSIEMRVRWSLKPQALWRIRQDLVALGVDVAELEGEAVDIESILNELFSSPHKALIGVTQVMYKPDGYDPLDPSSPQPRPTNNVVGIKSAQ